MLAAAGRARHRRQPRHRRRDRAAARRRPRLPRLRRSPRSRPTSSRRRGSYRSSSTSPTRRASTPLRSDRRPSRAARRPGQQRRRLRRPTTRVADFDLEEATRTLETNLFGAWRLVAGDDCRCCAKASDARVVNVSSGAGQLERHERRLSATGSRRRGSTRSPASSREEEDGIRVNSLCPGWVTDRHGRLRAPRSVEEGADTAVWLATDPGRGAGQRRLLPRGREPIPW